MYRERLQTTRVLRRAGLAGDATATNPESHEVSKIFELDYERTANDLFLKLNGQIIAKRGQPRSSHAGKWISLEPGYEVIDSQDGSSILIRLLGVRVH